MRSKLSHLMGTKWRTYFPTRSEHGKWEREIKGLFYGAFLLAFMLGAFAFFYRAFSYLSYQPQIGAALMNRILSIGFLTFFSMLLISNVITAISTLYRSPEVTYLFTTPTSATDIFTLKSIENLFFSSWAILILGSPIMIAYGAALHAPFFFYPLVVACLLIFIVIPASLSISATVIFSRFLASLKLRHILFSIAALFAILLTLFLVYIQPQVVMLEETEDISEVNRFLASLPVSSSYLSPSSWLTNIFNNAIHLHIEEVVFYSLVLISTALMCFLIAYMIGERFYYASWAESQTAKELLAVDFSRRRRITHNRIWHFFPQTYQTLLEKDSMVFFRDPVQWSQLLMLVVLLIFYVVTLRNIPSKVTHVFWKTMVSFFNFGFTGYVLATVSVRFVYPAISLEGRNFWVIGSAPIRLSTLFWAKFWQTFIIFFSAAQALVVISNYMLSVDPIIYYVGFFGTSVMSVSLTSISLGMGAIFPYFKERNPSKIASSAGGLVTVLISLIYVAIVVIIMAQPIHYYFRCIFYGNPYSSRYLFIAGAIVMLISLLATFIPIYFGKKSLESQDF